MNDKDKKLVSGILVVLIVLNFLGVILSGRIIHGVLVIYIIWALMQYKKILRLEKNSKIISAKVILVDNYHSPRKLTCQAETEEGIVYFSKKKRDNFIEKVGDNIEVKVDIENESIYEILDK